MNVGDFDRERRLFERLMGWPRDVGVTIGGYAASTLSVPRFSVDMDIVVPRRDHERAKEFLTSAEFRLERTSPILEQNYGGFVERWIAGEPPLTVDLLVDAVQDRRFKVPFSYDILAKDAKLMQIRGTRFSGFEARVIAPEAIIVLKVQPMRPRDAGDLACLAVLPLDMDKLRELARPLYEQKPDLLTQRLDRFEGFLGKDDEAAVKALGPRVPGSAKDRLGTARAARRLCQTLQSWLPHP